MDNKVSSAKAETPGIDWFCDIWQHRDCTGDTRRIQGDVPRLDDFNNVMSSYKCFPHANARDAFATVGD